MTTPVSSSPQARRFPRWLPLVTIPLCGAVLAVVMWSIPWGDNGIRSLATAASVALTIVLLIGWLIVFTRLPIVLRAAMLLGLLSLPAMFRVSGCTGDILPEFSFRWHQKPDVALAHTPAVLAEPIDLVPRPASDSPQFLGPQRTGVIPPSTAERRNHDWADTPPRELWRQPIGAGFGSFAVVGDYAFTQEQRADLELITCYELRTGKLVWTFDQHEERFSEVMGGDGPRSTPTIVDGRLYAMGARGRLDCLDAASGQGVWTQQVMEAADLPQWAKSCSPLIVDGLCVVSGGQSDDRSLVAYDVATGDQRWAVGGDPSSYSSPLLATLDGVRQIVIVNANSVTGHDLADGHILWRFDWPGDMPKVAQPQAVDGQRLLIGAAYGLGSKLLKLAVGDDHTWTVDVVWENRSLKPKFTDPILHDGYVYGIDDGRVLVCLDVETGKIAWRGGRYGHGQLLLMGDVLIVQSEDGPVTFVEATPDEHRELQTIDALSDRTWNIPTVAGDVLLVRNHIEAVCYALAAGGSDSPARKD